MRVNLGCGDGYMEGWVNVDQFPEVRADFHANAFDFVAERGQEIDELYMGHFLEHFVPDQAYALLSSMNRRIRDGATVSAVVPDFRGFARAYLDGEISNHDLNARFLYSYIQPSQHLWCHDAESLGELFRLAGYDDVQPIDPLTWEPVYWKTGPDSLWQCGVRATARPAQAPAEGQPPPVPAHHRHELSNEAGPSYMLQWQREVACGRRQHELDERQQQMVGLLAHRDAELVAKQGELDRIVESRTYRASAAMQRIYRKVIPAAATPGSRNGRHE